MVNMRIILDTDFESLTPNERRRFLQFNEIKLEDLAKKHKRSIASISYALDGKRPKLLKRIAESKLIKDLINPEV